MVTFSEHAIRNIGKHSCVNINTMISILLLGNHLHGSEYVITSCLIQMFRSRERLYRVTAQVNAAIAMVVLPISAKATALRTIS